jgi:hypothetical protein
MELAAIFLSFVFFTLYGTYVTPHLGKVGGLLRLCWGGKGSGRQTQYSARSPARDRGTHHKILHKNRSLDSLVPKEPATSSSEFGDVDDEIENTALKLRRERVAQLNADWKKKLSEDKHKWDAVVKKNFETAKKNSQRLNGSGDYVDGYFSDSWKKKWGGDKDGFERYSAIILGVLCFGMFYIALLFMRSGGEPSL